MKYFIAALFLFTVQAQAYHEHRCAMTTQGQVSATGTSAVMLAASASRMGLWLSIPSGSSSALVKVSNSGHTGTEGILVSTSGTLQFLPVPGGSVWVKSSAGTVPVNYQECE